MISVEEARERILAALHPTPGEVVALANAWGRVTAAPGDRAPHPAAGRRVRHGRLRPARRRRRRSAPTLAVIGSAPAGHPFAGTVGPGQAVRLFTGSVVPPGADAILLQEDATAAGTDGAA